MRSLSPPADLVTPRILLHASAADPPATRREEVAAPVDPRARAERPLRVLIAGGGTGGHLFPGVALAEEVKARGGEVLFVGTDRGIEARVLPEQGWALAKIDATGIKGRGLKGLLFGLLRLPRAWWQSLAIVRKFRPDVVVGVGGYASGPVVATAAMLLRPTAILEQNSIPGITNRILSRIVRRVFCTFPDRGNFFPKRKVVLTGNPIRRPILAALQAAGQVGAEPARPPRLFVFGGSQGARAINEMIVAALPELLRSVPDLEVWHQTGRGEADRVRDGYAALGLHDPRVRVAEFLTDMATPYAWCDLVLCRAGATSLAELAAAGRPAVLVPFPHATDNHQEHNARALVDAQAAVLLREREWTPASLATALRELLADRSRLAAMRTAMLAAARPGAAGSIYEQLAAL
jgi:UDP-N-acetylglucosamine--N-acetylmuramyl-(pentapeptide) pyrophosphoryl-undecaprenol N-acetylglucosamine transferase